MIAAIMYVKTGKRVICSNIEQSRPELNEMSNIEYKAPRNLTFNIE